MGEGREWRGSGVGELRERGRGLRGTYGASSEERVEESVQGRLQEVCRAGRQGPEEEGGETHAGQGEGQHGV